MKFSPENANTGMFDEFTQNWVQNYNKGYRGGFGFHKTAPEIFHPQHPPRGAVTASTPEDMLTNPSGMIGDFAGKSLGLGKYQTDNLNNSIGYATQYVDWTDPNRWSKVGIIQNFPELGQRGQTMGDILRTTNTNETLGQYFKQNTDRWSMPEFGMQTRGTGLSERVVRPQTAMQSKILDIRNALPSGGADGMVYNPTTKQYGFPEYDVDFGGVGNVYTPNTRLDNPYSLAEPSTRGIDSLMERILLKKEDGGNLPKAQDGREWMYEDYSSNMQLPEKYNGKTTEIGGVDIPSWMLGDGRDTRKALEEFLSDTEWSGTAKGSEESKAKLHEYLSSDKYRERLTASGYEDVDATIAARLSALNDTNIESFSVPERFGSVTEDDANTIGYYDGPKEDLLGVPYGEYDTNLPWSFVGSRNDDYDPNLPSSVDYEISRCNKT